MEPCEIARLPEELVSAALSRTSPRDACRAAAVSPAFRAAADSDAVWACFLPPLADLPPLPHGEPLPPRGKKDMFLRLSGSSVLLPGGLLVRTHGHGGRIPSPTTSRWNKFGWPLAHRFNWCPSCRACGWTGRPARSATWCRRGSCQLRGATRRSTGPGSISTTPGSLRVLNSGSFAGWKSTARYTATCCPQAQPMPLA